MVQSSCLGGVAERLTAAILVLVLVLFFIFIYFGFDIKETVHSGTLMAMLQHIVSFHKKRVRMTDLGSLLTPVCAGIFILFILRLRPDFLAHDLIFKLFFILLPVFFLVIIRLLCHTKPECRLVVGFLSFLSLLLSLGLLLGFLLGLLGRSRLLLFLLLSSRGLLLLRFWGSTSELRVTLLRLLELILEL